MVDDLILGQQPFLAQFRHLIVRGAAAFCLDHLGVDRVVLLVQRTEPRIGFLFLAM